MKTKKKRIARFVLMLLLGGLSWGCDLSGTGFFPDRQRAETEILRRKEPETANPTGPGAEEGPEILWISGVEYPEGYDWQRDTAYGRVDARLVLLRDGERVLDIPAGERHEVSTDPDMHRIFGGHLYTDYASGTETVVRQDGQELFRFGGREMFVGFLVREDAVWTLGVNRATGKGLVLRKNGEAVFSDPEGRLPPGSGNTSFEGGMLHTDGDALYFFYYSAQGWFRVREQFAEPISLPQDVTEVFDIRRIGGKTVLAGRTSAHGLVISQDGSLQVCTGNGPAARNISIVPGSGKGTFFLKGESVRGTVITPTLWRSDGSEITSSPTLVLDLFVEEGHTVYLSVGADGFPTRYVKDGVSFWIDGRNHFISSRCALLRNGTFLLLLTPADRIKPPFLIKDGIREDIPLNGYLTGLALTR